MKKHLKYCWLRVGLWMVDTCHWLGAFSLKKRWFGWIF